MRRAVALAALLAPLAARGDDDEMGRRLQEALRRRGESVHRCYGAALDRDPKAAGELLVQVELGEGGRVRRAEVLKDQTTAPGLAPCLVQTISGWTLPELRAAPGDRVVFPLAFRPDQAPPPPVVVGERHARRVPSGGKAPPREWVYIDERSHPGTQARLALASPPAASPAPVEARGAAVLYVLSGKGQLQGPGGLRLDVGPGDGALLPPGSRYALAGPLRYVLVSDLQKGAAPAAPPAPLVVRGAAMEGMRILGGRGRARILIDEGAAAGVGVGGRPLGVSLEELTCEAGVEIPVHQHDGSDELLYIVSGRGVMSAGEERDLAVGPGDAVRIPRGVPHGLVVKERLIAVQSYAPAGPEQRFRRPPAPPPQDVLQKKQ